MSPSTLQSIFTDVADCEIPKKELLVKVVRQISSLSSKLLMSLANVNLSFGASNKEGK